MRKLINDRLEVLGELKADMARALDVGSQDINNWMVRNSVPKKHIPKASVYLDCDLDSLLSGDTEGAHTERGLKSGKYDFIQQFNVRLAAGDGYYNGEYEEVESLAFLKSWLREKGWAAKELAVVQVDGDSMMPRLHDDDKILVKTTCTNVKNNKVYAILYADELRVKRLELRYDGALLIKSDNPAPEYSDQVIPAQDIENIKIVGRVVHLVSGGGFD